MEQQKRRQVKGPEVLVRVGSDYKKADQGRLSERLTFKQRLEGMRQSHMGILWVLGTKCMHPHQNPYVKP